MTTIARFTIRDLDELPDREGWRYEIIDGELYVTKAPTTEHQIVCTNLSTSLGQWNREVGLGFVMQAPGVIFADDDAAIPDVIWVRRETIRGNLDSARHLRAVAPELVIEVLSPEAENRRRDRELKLQLYGRRRVLEYWMVDWQIRRVEIYRLEGMSLRLAATLVEGDTLESPVLPGFSCPVSDLFEGLSGL